MKNNEIKERIGADTISKKNNVYTVRRSFFYRMNGSTEKFAEKVTKAFPNAQIIEAKEQWTPFRGGASVAQGSHWYVKFTIPE